MGGFGEFLGATLLIVLTGFFVIVAGALFGAISGWVVGLILGQAILGALASAGWTGITMWQLGATMGFIGAFFKSVSQQGQ
tara:strand:+ start:731 stop:973 length:243 start_codon:yes stop_codon:yes gene_type:complete